MMRILFLIAFMLVSTAAYADFSDEFKYTQGRMTGDQSVYKNSDMGKPANKDDGPVLGRNERERFKDAYNPKNECEYPGACEPPVSSSQGGRDHGRDYGQIPRDRVHWKVKRPYIPGGIGFLSPCQAQVQDEINAHTGAQDEIIFTGNPQSGLAFDRIGNRYNFSCAGGNISIW